MERVATEVPSTSETVRSPPSKVVVVVVPSAAVLVNVWLVCRAASLRLKVTKASPFFRAKVRFDVRISVYSCPETSPVRAPLLSPAVYVTESPLENPAKKLAVSALSALYSAVVMVAESAADVRWASVAVATM